MSHPPQTTPPHPAAPAPDGEMAALVRAKDWSATPLGTRDRWPVSLRTVVDMLLAQPFPMVLRWGPELIQIYNDAYRVIAAGKHPGALGQPTRECWPEAWDSIEPLFRRAFERGEATLVKDRPYALARGGRPEEAYFTFTYAPVRDDAGQVAGVLATVLETTDRVRAERERQAAEAARERLLGEAEAERSRLWRAFTNSPAFVATLRGPDHVFELANDRYLQLVGRRDVLNKPVREAIPELEGQGFFEVLDRVYATGEPFVGKDARAMLRRRADGWPLEERFVDFVFEPLRDVSAADGGSVSGILIHGVDVTDRRRVVEALRQSESRLLQAVGTAERTADRISRLQEVTEKLSEALTPQQVAEIVVDHGIRAMGASAGSMALLSDDGATLGVVRSIGYPEEVMRPWLRFPLDAPIPLSEVVRTGQPIFLESLAERYAKYPELVRVRAHKDTLASACIPLSVGGRTVGVMGLSFDREGPFSDEDRRFLTALGRQCGQALERARLYEAERAARQEAERASRAKDEFIAVLSHELRTPLTPVLLTVSLMESHPNLPPDLRDDVRSIRRNVELESRLIGDLLDLTRIARGKTQLAVQRVDLHLLLRGAIDICQREGSARLTTDLRATRHQVDGDGARLQQVFWNLINNAQKFTGPGGSIAVRSADAPGGRVRVEVADTGVGIDPAVLPKLFTAFEQGDTGTTRQFGGLGLGLAISKKLVELHGGTITASSPGKGGGATFVVELPALPTFVPARPAAPPVVTPQFGTGDRLRILLVEDHEPTLRVLTKLLEQMGHRVAAASSLAAARSAARGERFDLLLSDLGLPDGSGLDLMRELANQYAGRGIALTGYGMEDDVRNSAAAGFAAHLTKPIDFERLEEAIRQVTAAPSRANDSVERARTPST